jgi:hypothetical protein
MQKKNNVFISLCMMLLSVSGYPVYAISDVKPVTSALPDYIVIHQGDNATRLHPSTNPVYLSHDTKITFMNQDVESLRWNSRVEGFGTGVFTCFFLMIMAYICKSTK